MSEELCVTKVPIFRVLSEEQQRDIAELARAVRVKPGETFYTQGQDQAPMIVVHEGLVKLTRVNSDGKERVVEVLETGDFSGEATLLTRQRPDHSAIALTEATACVFPTDDFQTLLQNHPPVALAMLSTMSQRLSDSHKLVEDVTHRPVGPRVADYLLGLPAHHHATDGVQVQLPIPKKDVASLLGTTPESFSRALAGLVEQDWVRWDDARTLTLLDVDALTQFTA